MMIDLISDISIRLKVSVIFLVKTKYLLDMIDFVVE